MLMCAAASVCVCVCVCVYVCVCVCAYALRIVSTNKILCYLNTFIITAIILIILCVCARPCIGFHKCC